MFLRTTLTLLTVAALWLVPNAANAALPDDMAVEYYIREQPTNEESDVIYEVRLELTAVDRDGDSVAWEITEAQITEVGTNGQGVRAWAEEYPDLSAYDDVWWVEHDDPLDPDTIEFSSPPFFEGTAEARNQGDPDMDYELEGGNCDSSCQSLFDGRVTAFDFELRLVGENDPEEEGDDEPIEIPEGVDNSV